MNLPQFAYAHNVFHFNFLPVLNKDCLPWGVRFLHNVKTVVFLKQRSSSCRHILSKLLHHRLDLTTENLWILFEGHYTLIGSNLSQKFEIPLI